MGILKKGSYDMSYISDLGLSTLNIDKDTDVENVKFDKKDYLAIKEEGREQGYNEGFEKGYEEGYNKGLVKFEEEKEGLYAALESDKSLAKDFIESEGISYINSFQKDMQSLIAETINKIFFNCIDDELIMERYLLELLVFLKENVKSFSISINSITESKIFNYIEENSIETIVDNSLENYSVVVDTGKEKQEYFLIEEFDKIKKLFI